MSKYKLTLADKIFDPCDPEDYVKSFDDDGLEKELKFMDRTDDERASIKSEIEESGTFTGDIANPDTGLEFVLTVERTEQ